MEKMKKQCVKNIRYCYARRAASHSKGVSLLRLLLCDADEFIRLSPVDDLHTAGLVLEHHSEVLAAGLLIRSIQQLWMEGGANELRVSALVSQHVRDGTAVDGVQRAVNLIQQIEGRRIAALDGEDKCQSYHALLTAGQLMRGGSSAAERHFDGDAGERAHLGCFLTFASALLRSTTSLVTLLALLTIVLILITFFQIVNLRQKVT
jgi:hypothetical protein